MKSSLVSMRRFSSINYKKYFSPGVTDLDWKSQLNSSSLSKKIKQCYSNFSSSSLSSSLFPIIKPYGILSMSDSSNIKSSKKNNNLVFTATYINEDECYLLPKEENVEYDFIINENNYEKFYLLHRLDHDTSGLLLFSSSLEISKRIKKMFKHHLIYKGYYAITCINLNYLNARKNKSKFSPHPVFVFTDLLNKRNLGNKVRGNIEIISTKQLSNQFKSINLISKSQSDAISSEIFQTINSSSSRSRSPSIGCSLFQVQEVDWEKGVMLVALRPLSGLTHQLRLQLSVRDMMILGDDVYGDFQKNKEKKTKRMFLHSSEVMFDLRDYEKTKEFNKSTFHIEEKASDEETEMENKIFFKENLPEEFYKEMKIEKLNNILIN